MILKVFCVFDAKVEAYLQPFFLRTRLEAIRTFTEAANDGNSNIAKYPQDFVLFELGTYNDSNGTFSLHNAPLSCGCAIEFLHVTQGQISEVANVVSKSGYVSN